MSVAGGGGVRNAKITMVQRDHEKDVYACMGTRRLDEKLSVMARIEYSSMIMSYASFYPAHGNL